MPLGKPVWQRSWMQMVIEMDEALSTELDKRRIRVNLFLGTEAIYSAIYRAVKCREKCSLPKMALSNGSVCDRLSLYKPMSDRTAPHESCLAKICA